MRAISQKNLSDEILRDVLKQFITQLNTLNKSYLFIETEEREEILEFVYWMLHTKGYDDNFDDINALRDW